MGVVAALLELLITLMMLEYQLKGTEGIKEQFRAKNIVKGSFFLSLISSLFFSLFLLLAYNGKENALILFFLFFLYFFLWSYSVFLVGFAFLSGVLTVLRVPYTFTSRLFNKLTRLVV